MSETSPKKKRPPKLTPLVQDLAKLEVDPSKGSTVNNDATSNKNRNCNLESSVKVSIGDHHNILISPADLVVKKQLGQGQYGIVEKVYHETSGTYLAVKRVALKPGDDEEGKKLLMDVDILVKSSQCKDIIKFFGALIWEGDLWVLMELMDCSLDKFYKLAHRQVTSPSINSTADSTRSQFGHPASAAAGCVHISYDDKDRATKLGNCEICNPIPERVLGCMANDIVNALSYLYSIKVIHRDIKPSNILINRQGMIKLCDFGISGYLVNSVARTYDAGCRPYMAPERIDPPRDSTGYDIRSDVWSLGITMLEIATGRYPHDHARGFFEQLKCICTDEPPKLPADRFSSQFQDFITKCLMKNYQLRPKYDILQAHDFLKINKHYDIGEFCEKVLAHLPNEDTNTK